MATQIGLAIIATTLLSIAAFTWATIYYIPAILSGDDHGDGHGDDHGEAHT